MSHLRETAFTWTLVNFDLAPHSTGQWIESPAFSIDAMKESRFSLILYPRGWKEEDENCVSLFLKRHDDDADEKMSLDFELCLVDESGKCADVQRASPDESPKNIMRGNRRFCDRSRLMIGSSRQSLLPDNALTVRCRTLPMQDETDGEHACCLSDCEALSRDFAELLKSGAHSDLTIVAQEEEFRVHKAVLEARCPQLMSHLVSTENPDVMALQDSEAAALRAILHYLYTGIFEGTDNIEEVFIATKRYGITDLQALLFPYSYSLRAKTAIECFRVSFEWIIPDFVKSSQSKKELTYFLMSEDIPKSGWMKVSLLPKESNNAHVLAILKFQKLRNYHDGIVHFRVQVSDESGKLIPLKESESVFVHGKFETSLDIGNYWNKMLENCELKLRVDVREPSDSIRSSDAVAPLPLPIYPTPFQVSITQTSNSVSIEDVDVETMKSLLMHMYCGATDIVEDASAAIGLYAAADKYQLLRLKEDCCRYLKSKMDAENVGDMLLLADAHFDEGLKERAHQFIAANAGDVLRSQRGLKVLKSRADLYQDISNVLLQCVSNQSNRRKWKSQFH